MTHVAIDLIGEGLSPAGLLDMLPVVLDADPELVVTLVAPGDTTASALAERGIVTGERVHLVAAARGVAPGPDALREVRARRDAGVRVAARLVRDGRADAMVSVAPLEAVLAAARFTFGLVPGATRASAAVTVGAAHSPVVLCDAGGSVDVTADELAQFALVAAEWVRLRRGDEPPRIGLLSARPALSDALRHAADRLLGSLGLAYVGPVDAGCLRRALSADAGASGAGADVGVDVLVTDGFTGDVVLSLLRGGPAPLWSAAGGGDGRDHDRGRGRLNGTVPDGGVVGATAGEGTVGEAAVAERGTVEDAVAEGVAGRDTLNPAWPAKDGSDVQGGAIVLGVDGTAVQVDGPPSGLPAAVAAAVTAARGDLTARVRQAMATLVDRRRALAGLSG